MPYIERHPSCRSLLFLGLLCPLLYLPNLGLRELRPSEALLGTIGYEMSETLDLMHTRAHGEHVDAFPMYPWLVAFCSGFRHPTGFTTRLPAAGAILALALLSALTARRAGGALAGVVAGAMVIGNAACLRVGGRAQTETVLAFWLSAGWFGWYILGQERKQWTSAWLVACLCVFGGAFTAGARAVGYFYLPFFFMKRPVRGRQRLLLAPHLVGFGILTGLVSLWLVRFPDQPFMPWNVLREVPNVSRSYLFELAVFPLKCGIYLMPWTFLAWTPFCLAYRPLEARPALFRYLRTIVFSGFTAAWLLPHVSPLSLLPVLGPLAVMTGLHFEVLVRRHRKPLMRLVRLMSYSGLGVASICLIGIGLHLSDVVSFRDLPLVSVVCGVFLLSCAFCGALWLRTRTGKGLPLWLQLAVATAVLRSCWLATVPPLKAWSNNERKALGLVLAEGLSPHPFSDRHFSLRGMVSSRRVYPEAFSALSAEGGPEAESAADASRTEGAPLATFVSGFLPGELEGPTGIIYRVTPNYHITASFYMGRRLKHISRPDEELPADDPVVYVLGGRKPPIQASRTWTALTPPLDIRDAYEVVWVWFPRPYCALALQVVPKRDAGPRPSQILRLYLGRRR